MPRKYTKRPQTSGGGRATDAVASAFAASLRPLVTEMVHEIITGICTDWLAKNGPEDIPGVIEITPNIPPNVPDVHPNVPPSIPPKHTGNGSRKPLEKPEVVE